MPQITKPTSLNKVWASGGDRATPLDSKITQGWQIEIPPRQWFNWLDNRQDQAIAHINQHGIAVWDNQTEYQAERSYAQDPSNGVIYRCLATNVGNLPSTSPTFWTVAFADAVSAFSESAADAKFLAKTQNLNDLPNKTTARNNLSVYSQAQVNNLIAQAVANIPTTSLGVGQTWQNLTSSRVFGATYTNTTGRPIQIFVAGNLDSGTITIGGVSMAFQDYAAGAFLNHIIPAGQTYRVRGSGPGQDLVWAELR